MLSDMSIRRDEKYSFSLRVLLFIRKKMSVFFREKLNEKIRKELENTKEFTIFSNNCLGGVFYHDAARQFTSPLINTAMDGKDFIRFLKNPRYYLGKELEFFKWSGIEYPVARIDDIEIRFVHYSSEEECVQKWKERSERIVWNNIFVIATNHDGMYQEECMKEFDELKYNKIMFVSNEYPQYDWAILIKQFLGRYQCRITTAFANIKGYRYYETAFDIAKWIKHQS